MYYWWANRDSVQSEWKSVRWPQKEYKDIQNDHKEKQNKRLTLTTKRWLQRNTGATGFIISRFSNPSMLSTSHSTLPGQSHIFDFLVLSVSLLLVANTLCLLLLLSFFPAVLQPSGVCHHELIRGRSLMTRNVHHPILTFNWTRFTAWRRPLRQRSKMSKMGWKSSWFNFLPGL